MSKHSLYIARLDTKKKFRVGTNESLGCEVSGLAYDKIRDIMYMVSAPWADNNDQEIINSLFTVNRFTGEATRIGQFYDPGAPKWGMCDISCDKYGRLWGSGIEYGQPGSPSDGVFSIDVTTGRATLVVPIDDHHGGGCAFGKDGRLYVVYTVMYKVNVNTQTVEDVIPLMWGSADYGAAAVDPRTGRFLIMDDYGIFSVDLESGAISEVIDAIDDNFYPPIGSDTEVGGLVWAPGQYPPPIRYVDFDDGDDNNNGWTPSSPWKTIKGPDEDYHGRDIGPGYEYRLKGTFTIPYHTELIFIDTVSNPEWIGTAENPVIFTSWPGESIPVIDGVDGNHNYGVSLNSWNNGLEPPIYYVIENIHFTNNIALNINASQVLIRGCHFTSQSKAASNADDVTVDSCLFETDNDQLHHYEGQRFTVKNSIFRDTGPHTADYAVYLYGNEVDLTATVVNNTFVDFGVNHNNNYTVKLAWGGDFIVANNIFASCWGTAIYVELGDEGVASIGYNLLFDTDDHYLDSNGDAVIPLGNNVEADPLLIDPGGGDFRLYNGSPAINAGNPAVAPDHDFSNLERDQQPDIGALEGGWGDPPPITNDDWQNAFELVGNSGTIDGDNTGFTIQEDEWDEGSLRATAWYKFTAPSDGYLHLWVRPKPGSNFLCDYVVSFTDIYPPTDSDGDFVSYGDSYYNSWGGQPEGLVNVAVDIYDVYEGTTYLIQIEPSDYEGERDGPFEVEWIFRELTYSGADFDLVPSVYDGYLNDYIEGRDHLTIRYLTNDWRTHSANNIGATLEPAVDWNELDVDNVGCGKSLWYYINNQIPGHIGDTYPNHEEGTITLKIYAETEALKPIDSVVAKFWKRNFVFDSTLYSDTPDENGLFIEYTFDYDSRNYDDNILLVSVDSLNPNDAGAFRIEMTANLTRYFP